jgi:hypothetical protein
MAISNLITFGIGEGGSPTDIILMGLAAAGNSAFDSIAVYACLDGNWTDISADVIGGVSYSGVRPINKDRWTYYEVSRS